MTADNTTDTLRRLAIWLLGYYHLAEHGEAGTTSRNCTDARCVGAVHALDAATPAAAPNATAERSMWDDAALALLLHAKSVILKATRAHCADDPWRADASRWVQHHAAFTGEEEAAAPQADEPKPDCAGCGHKEKLHGNYTSKQGDFRCMGDLMFCPCTGYAEPLPAVPDPADTPRCGFVPPSEAESIGSCVRPAEHAGDHLGPEPDDIAWKAVQAVTCGHQYPGSLRQPGDRPILCTLPPHDDEHHCEPETGSFWHTDGKQWGSVAITDPRPAAKPSCPSCGHPWSWHDATRCGVDCPCRREVPAA